MKNILLSFILLFSITTYAQVSDVEEINAAMSEGTNRGYKVLIPEADKKAVIKAWSKFMKGYDAKTSKVKKEDDYLSPDASMPALNDMPIQVYALFQETPEGVYMNTFFNMGSGYLNSEQFPAKAEAAKQLLKSFAINTAKAAVEEELSGESKKLSKLEKEQKGLEKDKAGYEKDIAEAKALIEKQEKAIVDNDKAQKLKIKEVADQKALTEEVQARLKKY